MSRRSRPIIAGKIDGGLTVEDKLEIGYTAVIHGKVSARTIAIAKGAIVDGEIEVTSGTPVIEFEEKRDAKHLTASRALRRGCSRMATDKQIGVLRASSRILSELLRALKNQ